MFRTEVATSSAPVGDLLAAANVDIVHVSGLASGANESLNGLAGGVAVFERNRDAGLEVAAWITALALGTDRTAIVSELVDAILDLPFRGVAGAHACEKGDLVLWLALHTGGKALWRQLVEEALVARWENTTASSVTWLGEVAGVTLGSLEFNSRLAETFVLLNS